MKDYVKLIKNEKAGSISVCFYVTQEKIAQIGTEMKKINDQADMNGHNWEALLGYYIDENHPEVAGGGWDSSNKTFEAFYKLTPANETKAQRLAAIIEELVENETRLYDLVRDNGDEIDWE